LLASAVGRELQVLANQEMARHSQAFFKTGQDGYAAGDKFIGITVPAQRSIASQFKELSLSEIAKLLANPIHEYRFVALEILVFQYEKVGITENEKRKIIKFYLNHKPEINNWDLVDTSAPYLLGDWLISRERPVLYKLVKSKQLWDRRIAVVATLGLIRHGDYYDTLRLAELLLDDEHDLIHKAAGWMLREVGKKSPITLERFLDKQVTKMPRTILRYAIERFSKEKRLAYLAIKKQG